MINFGHPLVITAIVFTIVFIIVFGIYRLKSRSKNHIIIQEHIKENTKQKLPAAYRNIDLLRDTVIICLTDQYTIKEENNNTTRRYNTLKLNQLQMIARFIKNDYIYCRTQVYREGDILYLYGNSKYHMLVPKNYQGNEYIWPELVECWGGVVSGLEDHIKFLPADEDEFTKKFKNPDYHFKYDVDGKDYVCNFAYPSFKDYVGLCDNTTDVNYEFSSFHIQNNYTYFYKVTKFDGEKMDIEDITEQKEILIDNKQYNVFGIYDELNRLFMFDHANKRYMPIIWSNEKLDTSVVNKLDLHKPYFFCNDTSVTKFETLEDILCINHRHWVVQDDSTQKSYDLIDDGGVTFDPTKNELVCNKSKRKVIFASSGNFNEYHLNIRNSRGISNVIKQVSSFTRLQPIIVENNKNSIESRIFIEQSSMKAFDGEHGKRTPMIWTSVNHAEDPRQVGIRRKSLKPHEKMNNQEESFPANEWFEQVTGKKEQDWTDKITVDTFRQEHFKVDNNNMISIVNSKTKVEWNAGELFYESIGQFSNFKHNDIEIPLPKGNLPIIELFSGTNADIKQIMAIDLIKVESGQHMFQAASQFDGLESATDTQKTSRFNFFSNYIYDSTQGPFVSLMAPAAAISRRDYVLGQSQIPNNPVNYLDELSQYFTVENGYIVGNDKSKSLIDNNDNLLQKVKVMYNKNATVYFDIRKIDLSDKETGGTISLLSKPIQVHQVFTAAMNIGQGKSGYLNRTQDNKENLVVKLQFLLEAAYTSTYLAAHKCGARFLWLTLVGGGVFGNFIDLIVEAINKVHSKYGHGLSAVFLCDYDGFVMQNKIDGSLIHNEDRMKKPNGWGKIKVTSTKWLSSVNEEPSWFLTKEELQKMGYQFE